MGMSYTSATYYVTMDKQIFILIPIFLTFKISLNGAGRMAQVVEHLLSKCVARYCQKIKWDLMSFMFIAIINEIVGAST
jgi:hypothetical protein